MTSLDNLRPVATFSTLSASPPPRLPNSHSWQVMAGVGVLGYLRAERALRAERPSVGMSLEEASGCWPEERSSGTPGRQGPRHGQPQCLSSVPSGVYNLGRGDMLAGVASAYRLPRAMGASVDVGVCDIPACRALSWRRLGFAEQPARPRAFAYRHARSHGVGECRKWLLFGE